MIAESIEQPVIKAVLIKFLDFTEAVGYEIDSEVIIIQCSIAPVFMSADADIAGGSIQQRIRINRICQMMKIIM